MKTAINEVEFSKQQVNLVNQSPVLIFWKKKNQCTRHYLIKKQRLKAQIQKVRNDIKTN